MQRIGLSAAALGAVPFFLAYRGAPTPAEAAVFALAVVQLAAACIVAHTGRLRLGRVVAAGSCATISLVLALGMEGATVAAAVWAVLAGVEAGAVRRGASGFAVAVVLTAALLAVASCGGGGGMGTALAAAVAALAILAGVQRASPGRHCFSKDEARGAALRAAAGDTTIVLAGDGTVLHADAESGTRLGIAPDTLAGGRLLARMHPADRVGFLALIADAARDDGTRVGKVRLHRDATVEAGRGDSIPVEVRVHRLGGIEGDVAAVLRPVAAPSAAPCEAPAAVGTIHIAPPPADGVLANVSHELRAPLNAIIGFSEMLASRTLQPRDGDKQREYARIINQAGQHLLGMVNAILDVSKDRVEAERAGARDAAEHVAVAALVAQSCDIVRLAAQERGVTVLRDIPADLGEVDGDARACRQILINLLSNAVKFTGGGGRVSVAARREATSLHFTVTDTGVGIDAGDLSRLGDRFFRAGDAASRATEGTGLGLSVVRSLVETLGGDLAFDSEVGRGTRVTVSLPRRALAAASQAPDPRHARPARRHLDAVPTTNHHRLHERMKQLA